MRPSERRRSRGSIELGHASFDLQVGDPLLLEKVGDEPTVRHPVRVIGYLEGETLLVTTPRVGGKVTLVRNGQVYAARLKLGNRVVAFTTQVLRVNMTPYPYLHLTYPQEMENIVVRRAPRVEVDMIVAVSAADIDPAPSHPARMLDISASGARIVAERALAETDSEVRIAARLAAGSVTRDVALKGIVRNIAVIEPETAEAPRLYQHGMELSGNDEMTDLTLQAFLYTQIVREISP